MVGSFKLPEEGYHDYLTYMFGDGAHVASGSLHPEATTSTPTAKSWMPSMMPSSGMTTKTA